MGRSSRPVIAVSCYVEPATRPGWTDVASALLPHAYVRQVEAVGGVVLLVPPRSDADDALAEAVLARVDGLIIAGGADVEPSRYAADPHPSVQSPRRDRDALELALARVSRAHGIPTLGICRGMQVMAVAAGGTLEQHVPDRVGHEKHAPEPGTYSVHGVSTVAGTALGELLGASLDVPSFHHQSVLSHPGYAAAAWADDGTLEGMEDETMAGGGAFRLAVQWHPEEGTDPRLFTALVSAAMG